MTQNRIKNWTGKNKILVSIIFVPLVVLIWDISTTENKLFIKTDQPEDNFVVVCGWYSNFLNLHGGRKRVWSRVLIVSSNSYADCGWSLYGHLSVTVMHPLYRQVWGCDSPMMCVSPDFRYKDRTMVFMPVTFEHFLTSLPEKYAGEELFDKVRSHIRGHFSNRYLYNYAESHKPDIENLMSLYNDRLIKTITPIYNHYDFGKGGGTPKSVVERYWNHSK